MHNNFDDYVKHIFDLVNEIKNKYDYRIKFSVEYFCKSAIKGCISVVIWEPIELYIMTASMVDDEFNNGIKTLKKILKDGVNNE